MHVLHARDRQVPVLSHPRLQLHAVDFADLPTLPPLDDVYITLGTTLAAAGSQNAFRAVDYDAVLATPRAARAAGATRCGVVTAMGANAHSRIFYNRIKGEVEHDLQSLGFTRLLIARPSLMIGERQALQQAARPAESLSIQLCKWLDPIIPANYRARPGTDIARALFHAVQSGPAGLHVLSGRALQPPPNGPAAFLPVLMLPSSMRPNDLPQPLATLMVATCNVLNLANPGRMFYENQDPYSATEYERKITWLGERFRMLNADVLAVQEVWDDAAFKDALGCGNMRYDFVAVPGAENDATHHGAHGTPRVGIATRLKVEASQSFPEYPPGFQVEVPGIGLHTRFERPPLVVTLRMKHGQTLNVLTAHLKSKRPKFLQDAQGNATEDRDDRKVMALASLRSLIMRGAEAMALRCLVIDLLHRTNIPLVVLGDFNDTPDSVTTQLICATTEIAYDRSARDVALFNAYDLQGDAALKKDVAYSHIHQGAPYVLDQILVSEEFMAAGRNSVGDVRKVDYFNDHLHEGRDRTRSDHGFVRALLRLKMHAHQPPSGSEPPLSP